MRHLGDLKSALAGSERSAVLALIELAEVDLQIRHGRPQTERVGVERVIAAHNRTSLYLLLNSQQNVTTYTTERHLFGRVIAAHSEPPRSLQREREREFSVGSCVWGAFGRKQCSTTMT